MNKQKLIISSYDDLKNPYYAGGGARAIHETAKRLLGNYDITVITGAYEGAKKTKIDGVSYERIGMARGGPKLGQIVYQLILPWYVMRKSYDVWIESFTPPFSTGLLQLFTKKPVVGLVHMLSGEDMRRKYKLPFDVIEALGLKAYHSFITPSEAIERAVRKHAKKASIAIIPNGIEPVVRSYKRKNDYFLFLGRIEMNQKGLDLLLKAFSDIHQTIPQRLLIAGGGEQKQIELLTSLISDLGLTNSVDYIGPVQGESKQKLLSEATAVIVPSRFETFSMVCLEALGVGTPLITGDIPGLSWIPSDARLAVPLTSQSLANAIKKLSTSSQLRTKLSQRGKTFTKHQTWEKVANDYTQYIQQIQQ